MIPLWWCPWHASRQVAQLLQFAIQLVSQGRAHQAMAKWGINGRLPRGNPPPVAPVYLVQFAWGQSDAHSLMVRCVTTTQAPRLTLFGGDLGPVGAQGPFLSGGQAKPMPVLACRRFKSSR